MGDYFGDINMFSDDYQDEKDYIYYKPFDEQKAKRQGRIVYQVDVDDGHIIKDFCSAREAARELGINDKSIRDVCNGKQSMAAGYYWMWQDPNRRKKYIDMRKNHKVYVKNLLTGEEVTYKSIRDCIIGTNVSYRTMTKYEDLQRPYKGLLFKIL